MSVNTPKPEYTGISVSTDIPVATATSKQRLDPEHTLELVLEALGELIDYELAVVLGLEGSEILRVRKTAGPLAGPGLKDFAIVLRDRGDLARIMEKGEPKLFDESEEHVDTYDGVLDLPHGHSCLVAPLSCGGKSIGLLTLDHRSCGKFTPGVVRFIATISKLISISMIQSDAASELVHANADLVRERNALFTPGYEPLTGLVGSSPAWIRAIEAIRMVAGTELPVLVLGETGTGKELASRSIHRLSARADQPFVAVNCSALAPSLAESELFGHEKGAFTGASSSRKGRFELADGGTLFLDEIGDLPMELQPKLLRIIQEGTFERVGSERTIRVSVRIVAATHVDLAEAARNGRFREDLYYRLSVFPVHLPALKERSGDILLLAETFLADIRTRPGFSGTALSVEAARILEERDWPGNVRELRNALERAAILARGGLIGEAHVALSHSPVQIQQDQILPNHFQQVYTAPTGKAAAGKAATGEDPTIPSERDPAAEARSTMAGLPGILPTDNTRTSLTLDDAQRTAIYTALEKSRGRIYGAGGAAELLDLKPSTLQSRMKKLGMGRRP
jgi:hydrogenase-4 transcriptional activator